MVVMRYVYKINDNAIVCVQRYSWTETQKRGLKEYYVAVFPLTKSGEVRVKGKKPFFSESFFYIEDAQERLDMEAAKLGLKEWSGEM